MRNLLRIYSSKLSLIATCLAFVSIFFAFLSGGLERGLWGNEYAFFDYLFSSSKVEIRPYLTIVFFVQIIGIVCSFISFVFTTLGKKQIRKSSIFALISCVIFLFCILSYVCSFRITNCYYPGLGPIMMSVFLLLAILCSLPTIFMEKLEKKKVN